MVVLLMRWHRHIYSIVFGRIVRLYISGTDLISEDVSLISSKALKFKNQKMFLLIASDGMRNSMHSCDSITRT
jgi:hypothetical protein